MAVSKGKKSPLHEWHCGRGARMTLVDGLLSPMFYKTFEREKSFEREYGELRRGAGLLDFHGFEALRIESADAARVFDHLFASDIRSVGEGGVVQTLMCDNDGNIIDRVWLIFQEMRATLICTPGRGEKVASMLADSAINAGVEVERVSDISTVLCLVGPLADDVMARALKQEGGFQMNPWRASVLNIFTAKALLARVEMLGGMPAYLIVTGSSYAPIVAEHILTRGQHARPCGMAAFEAARVESGEPLLMREAAAAIAPSELDLMEGVDRHKDFRGHAAVLEAANSSGKWLASVVMKERTIPRNGSPVLDHNGNRIGSITSGVYSPKLANGIGLAVIDQMAAFIGNELGVAMHGRVFAAEVGARPLVMGAKASQF